MVNVNWKIKYIISLLCLSRHYLFICSVFEPTKTFAWYWSIAIIQFNLDPSIILISRSVHIKSMPVGWWRSWGISWPFKQMIDIGLRDRRSLNWRMSRLMSRMSSTCVCYDSLSSSQTCSEWSIISLKSVLLQGISHSLLPEFNQLLFDWTMIIYPEVSLINWSSEQLIVLIDSVESCFDLSGVLVLEIVVHVDWIQLIFLYLRLDWTDSSQRTRIKPISLSVGLNSCQISDFYKLCL